VIMSTGVFEFWHADDRLFDQNRMGSYGQKTPVEVVERFLLQMEKLLDKNYRVAIATIPPYEILPNLQPPHIRTINRQWFLK